VLYKEYENSIQLEKKNACCESQGACRQDELIGGKLQVVM
jgi:hypothetical protein